MVAAREVVGWLRMIRGLILTLYKPNQVGVLIRLFIKK